MTSTECLFLCKLKFSWVFLCQVIYVLHSGHFKYRFIRSGSCSHPGRTLESFHRHLVLLHSDPHSLPGVHWTQGHSGLRSRALQASPVYTLQSSGWDLSAGLQTRKGLILRSRSMHLQRKGEPWKPVTSWAACRAAPSGLGASTPSGPSARDLGFSSPFSAMPFGQTMSGFLPQESRVRQGTGALEQQLRRAAGHASHPGAWLLWVPVATPPAAGDRWAYKTRGKRETWGIPTPGASVAPSPGATAGCSWGTSGLMTVAAAGV